MKRRGAVPRVFAGRLVLLSLALLAGSCSMFRGNNRRTLNWLDESFTPVSTGGKIALAPVAFPIGVFGFAADLAIVHPAATIDDAWSDTEHLLWQADDESALRRALFVPVAVLATPFVFAGDWIGRWFLPIDSGGPAHEEKQ
jgi:hypothetical protein